MMDSANLERSYLNAVRGDGGSREVLVPHPTSLSLSRREEKVEACSSATSPRERERHTYNIVRTREEGRERESTLDFLTQLTWTSTMWGDCNQPIRSNNDMKKLRGGQRKTWIKNLEKDLHDMRLHPQEYLADLTEGRSLLRKRCKKTQRWFLNRKWRRHRRRRRGDRVGCGRCM